MPKEVKPNKLNAAQKRSAENRKDRLKEQHVSQDHAEKLAIRSVKNNRKSGKGGGSSAGGEAKKKHLSGGGRQRTGSDSNANK